jgi:hypothetical protein
MCRDTGILDGDLLDVVEVLRVFWTHESALTEMHRLRAEDSGDDHFYYCAATEIARP